MSMNTSGLMISPEAVEAFLQRLLREHIEAQLPRERVEALTRHELRERIGTVSLKQAARYLGFKDAESCRRRLARAAVPRVKLSGKQLGYRVEDLHAFRESCVVGRKQEQPTAGAVIPWRDAA